MTGNAINAKGDELSSEQLDAVSGGMWCMYLPGVPPILLAVDRQVRTRDGGGGGMNDPAQMFQQILQQSPRAAKRAGCG